MAERWILRKGSKRSGFRYVTEAGAPVRAAATLARADALRIPPAWTDVHVAASPTSAIQAWGFDAKGRKQYRYHDREVARGQLRKYYRVRRLAHDLPGIRAALDRDLRKRTLDRCHVAAGVVRLISEGFFRVGNERYAAENATFGIATLRKEHVVLHDDRAVFHYVGKKSIEQHQTVCEPALVEFVRALALTPGYRLFRWVDDDGEWHDLTARDVNEYLHELLGVPYTAKDFRTWGGTLRVATILADLGEPASDRDAKKNVVTAVRLVAAELGNTPTVCRASYVHPLVIARYLDAGTTIAPFLPNGISPARDAHRPEERALIRFLDKFFPERRRHKRDRRRRGRDDADRRALRAA
ncbi:DNA topoisomerase I catalytic core domain protein [Gemmatirosa kalamazoonensis]|uniref:DNA topoisomerase n=1 Tax=Gemmatirosa kalamazoonensis TaxID=861299 RepID=W0RIW9_9BACT|nr:DNA topoisomerase IB [Gemmatirosa kalamazoonensis]AHG90270.1 DNA topoisomerase I catalytic core domain protein [Gemmatirosa kalamazoonensis]